MVIMKNQTHKLFDAGDGNFNNLSICSVYTEF